MKFDIRSVESVYVEKHEFQVLKDGTKGRLVIDLELNSGGGKRRTLKFGLPISSMWIEPETNTAIRAFCRINKGSYRNLTLLKIIKKFKMVRVPTTGKVLMEFNGTLMYRDKPGVPSEVEDEDYNVHTLHENKTSLMISILDSISAYRPVGGFEFCNLNMIPDKLFLSFGFVMIEDTFSNMGPMWKAKIASLLNPESGAYNYRTDGVKKRGELLLKMVQAILEGRSVMDVIKAERIT